VKKKTKTAKHTDITAMLALGTKSMRIVAFIQQSEFGTPNNTYPNMHSELYPISSQKMEGGVSKAYKKNKI
jgi:hypothetical protein